MIRSYHFDLVTIDEADQADGIDLPSATVAPHGLPHGQNGPRCSSEGRRGMSAR